MKPELKRFAFCHYCGSKYNSESWPRVCLNEECKQMHWSNPLPVAVLIVPIILDSLRATETGVLLVRRLIKPFIGELALPGGFIVSGETWRQGGARELFEETGIDTNPDQIVHLESFSDDQNHIVIFGRTSPIDAKELECFHTNEEVSELIVTTKPIELCFPAHSLELKKFLTQ